MLTVRSGSCSNSAMRSEQNSRIGIFSSERGEQVGHGSKQGGTSKARQNGKVTAKPLHGRAKKAANLSGNRGNASKK